MNSKLKTIFDFLRVKSMYNSGVEAHQVFFGVKATNVVLNFGPLWSNRNK